MHRIRILPAATRELEQLDKPVARRMARRINWLAANVDNIKPEPYMGDLAGLCKFRVGDYRVIYEILHDEQVLVIHQTRLSLPLHRARHRDLHSPRGIHRRAAQDTNRRVAGLVNENRDYLLGLSRRSI